MRIPLLVAGGFSLVMAAASGGQAVPAQSTVTGWFTCDRCGPAARVKAKEIRPANRDCVQKCVTEGAGLVFLDEKARTILRVANPAAAKGQESHYVQVTGAIDRDAHTLTVGAVKVLREYVAKCGRSTEAEK